MPTPIRDGQIHLTSDGGTALALPSTVSRGDIYRRFTTRTAKLATGGEVPVAGPFPESFDIYVQGIMQADGSSEALIKIDQLKAVLMDAPIQLRLQGASAERYLEVYPVNLAEGLWQLERYGRVSLQFRAHNPYWLSDTIVNTETGITATATSWTLSGVDGNIRPPPVVTVTFTTGANGSNFALWNTSGGERSFTVPGTFVAGDVLVVDTERMQVLKNGTVSLLDQMSDEFLLEGWPLSIGENRLTAYLTGTVQMNVAVAYRSRWI